MEIQHKFPTVHWIWHGGISSVYEVDPRIVVKVPKPGEYEREQFLKEIGIYRVFSQNAPCPYIVQCFYFCDTGIFLEYMRDITLFCRIEGNLIRNYDTMVVTKVNKLEPRQLRLQWMNDLTQAIAFLESLNIAHGDLRPENILLDRDRLKVSDFDCAAEFGTVCVGYMCPYGRLLNDEDSDLGERGTFGLLGARTEQFALGSVYYFINYGFEVYNDRCLAEDRHKHGPKVVDLFQSKVFPVLGADHLIDNLIHKCWHNKYEKVSGLAAEMQGLLKSSTSPDAIESKDGANKESSTEADSIKLAFDYHQDENISKRQICQDLEKRGLLDALDSGEPQELGFRLDFYRYRI